MQQLFGIPIERLALLAGLGSALILAALLLALLRRPVLLRLALRNAPRRPGSALLVVAGLALGTAIVTSALFTGDTMTYTVRSLVADSLGRVDEVVVQSWLGPRAQNRRWMEALAQGAPLTAGSSYFDLAVFERLIATRDPDGAVAALVPAIAEQVTLVDRTTQQLILNANLIGIPVALRNGAGVGNVSVAAGFTAFSGGSPILTGTTRAVLVVDGATSRIKLTP